MKKVDGDGSSGAVVGPLRVMKDATVMFDEQEPFVKYEEQTLLCKAPSTSNPPFTIESSVHECRC